MTGLDKQKLFMPGFPKIVCLCGSTRFMEAFQAANLSETMQGHIVLSVGCNTKSDVEISTLYADWERTKEALDDLHKRKIDLADEVLVLNVGGYVGESTRSEIEYAEAQGKPVRYLEPPFGGIVCDPNATDEQIEEARISDEMEQASKRRMLAVEECLRTYGHEFSMAYNDGQNCMRCGEARNDEIERELRLKAQVKEGELRRR